MATEDGCEVAKEAAADCSAEASANTFVAPGLGTSEAWAAADAAAREAYAAADATADCAVPGLLVELLHAEMPAAAPVATTNTVPAANAAV